MIPKVIHYFWFGGAELPELERSCIASWSRVMPDWEVRRWDEGNFDAGQCAFCRDAYEAGKWAFVSDYARYKVLFEEGGVALDTDVEALKPLDSFLGDEAFSGFMQNGVWVNPGLVLGSAPGSSVVGELASTYEGMAFELRQGRNSMDTSPRVLTPVLERRCGLRRDGTLQRMEGFTVYPASYFDPLDSHSGKLEVSEDTYTVHHYAGSWLPPAKKYRVDLRKKLAPKVGSRLSWLISSAASVVKYGREAF